MFRAFFKKGNTEKLSFFKIAVFGASSVALGGLSYSYYGKYREEQGKVELSRSYFVKYKVTWRSFVDKDHYLLEIEPLKHQKVNLWRENGYRNLWSVEIKQPEIHVVRNYTPLPLKHVSDGESEKNEPKLNVLDGGKADNGKMMFYIKKYDNGEVARWLSQLPIGHHIEVRGPYVEYTFPESPEDEIVLDTSFLNLDNEKNAVVKTKYKQFDINFFTGGTGIVTPLQLLLTQNPFKGRIQVIHACKDYQKELRPLLPILAKLEMAERLQIRSFEDFRSELKRGAQLNGLIDPPYPFRGITAPNDTGEALKPIFSFVVGPEGFIASVCGPKFDLHQGPVTGFLGKKGWDNNTVYKLS